MPRKPNLDSAGEPALPSIPKELIDQFLKGPMTAETVQLAPAAFKGRSSSVPCARSLATIWPIRMARVGRAIRSTSATTAVARPCRLVSVRHGWKFHATVTILSSRS